MHNTIVASLGFGLVALLTGCGGGGAANPAPSQTTASPSQDEQAQAFPTAAFAVIGDNPVAEEVEAEFQAALRDMSDLADGAGMSATVMSAEGTWSGATGSADGERDLRVDDQFAIGSVTKSVVAAQVMQMVEAGQLDLDYPVAEHLPPDLNFDTNAATIRDLLGHRSGIPDYDPFMLDKASTNPKRHWAPAELLTLVPADRAPLGQYFEYSSTNYLLLGLVIEQVSGQPVSAVLRDGVLNIDGAERLIYQPDEVPTEPMAMPGGGTTAALEKGGGFLPSLANATGGGPASAMASDSPSLARWWRALCAGEIVSRDSLTQMVTWQDDYGLGLFNVADPYARAVGHAGWDVGYVSWAGCLPEDGMVIVVLSNGEVDDIGGMARPLVVAARSRS
jgi:D-alanyl-D-alanine carboxypeptidase